MNGKRVEISATLALSIAKLILVDWQKSACGRFFLFIVGKKRYTAL